MKNQDFYTVEAIGFQNFSRKRCATIESARAEWKRLSTEQYTVKGTHYGDPDRVVSWNSWELWKNGDSSNNSPADAELVAQGKFEAYAKATGGN